MAVIIDKAVADRFKRFRKKYVANSGLEASKLLKVNQSDISRIENGERKISDKTINILIKEFKLNREWLLDGKGSPQLSDKPQKPINYLEVLSSRVDALTIEMKILSKNLDKAFEIIEAQGRLIEQLRK